MSFRGSVKSGLLVYVFCCMAYAQNQADNPWQLITDKEGIRVYQKNADDSEYHVIKGTVTVPAGLRKTVAFLQDESINTRWVPYSGGAELLERPVPEKSIVHFMVEGRWPFEARDAIASFHISQDNDLSLTIDMKNRPDFLPEHPERIRMQTYSGYWRLSPVAPDRTDVVYQSHVDPGGHIPPWLANRFALETTWQALANLRAQIKDYENPEAVNGRLAFIRELRKKQQQE